MDKDFLSVSGSETEITALPSSRKHKGNRGE